MGFFQKIFGQLKQKNLKTTDKREAKCPYCNGQLKKIPSRKTECPHCSQFIYVRTRPKDNTRVVVTKDEADKIDEEWSVVAGTYDIFVAEKEEFKKEQEILRKRLGEEPSENDVKWSVLNKRLIEHARNGDWGLYRNTRFDMAEILRKEMRFKNALQIYLEVCYLDLNGPNNTGGTNDLELLKEFPPFDPKMAFIAPGIVDRARILTKKLKMTHDEIKEIFIKHNQQICENLKLPLNPEETWGKLEPELKSAIDKNK